jgi:hypothetical protein
MLPFKFKLPGAVRKLRQKLSNTPREALDESDLCEQSLDSEREEVDDKIAHWLRNARRPSTLVPIGKNVQDMPATRVCIRSTTSTELFEKNNRHPSESQELYHPDFRAWEMIHDHQLYEPDKQENIFDFINDAKISLTWFMDTKLFPDVRQ